RIEGVDIETKIGRCTTGDGANASCNRGRARLVHLLCRNDGDAVVERPVINIATHRRADADLHHLSRSHKPFRDCVIEYRAVAVSLTETAGPGVDMRIEVNQCQWAVP